MMSHLLSSGVSLPFCFFVMMSHQASIIHTSLLTSISRCLSSSTLFDATFVHTLLHYTADLVVDWVQVRAVRWPEIMSDEVGCLALQQLNSLMGTMSRRTVLLEDEHVAYDRLDGRKHLLREQDIVVILAIDLCTLIHEDESSDTHFRHGD